MYVVTFSGVVSGGIVTSGTMCWTWKYHIRRVPAHSRGCETYMRDVGFLDERSDDRALADALWRYVKSSNPRPDISGQTVSNQEDSDISAHDRGCV